jgi:hypothetical protein
MLLISMLTALRMSVRSSLYDRTNKSSHEHQFGPETYNEADDTYTHTCITCDYAETFEKMWEAVDWISPFPIGFRRYAVLQLSRVCQHRPHYCTQVLLTLLVQSGWAHKFHAPLFRHSHSATFWLAAAQFKNSVEANGGEWSSEAFTGRCATAPPPPKLSKFHAKTAWSMMLPSPLPVTPKLGWAEGSKQFRLFP